MKETAKTLFVQSRYDLGQTKQWLSFYTMRFLPAALLVSLFCCLLLFPVLILVPFRAMTVPEAAPSGLVFSFCTAVVGVMSGHVFACLANCMVIFFIFFPLGIVGWFLVQLVLNALYLFFFPSEYRPTQQSKRYDAFLSAKLRRSSFFVRNTFIVVVVVICTVAAVKDQSILLMVHIMGVSFCCSVPYVFGFHWSVFIRILKRKQETGRKVIRFKAYLFSEYAIRSSFLNSVKFMISTALIAWVLIPIPIVLSERIAGWTGNYFALLSPNYETVRTQAQRELVLQKYQWDKVLPPAGTLGMFGLHAGLKEAFCPQYGGSALFLRYLFSCVALGSFVAVALPVSVRATHHQGYSVAVKKLLIASAKTTTVVLFLKFFVAKAFLVDFASVLGLGTAFTYILAGFLAFQNREEKTERTRASNTTS